MDTTSAAVDVIWAASLLITVGKLTGQAGKRRTAESLPLMLAQKPKH